MVFINAWCEIIRSLKYVYIDVWTALFPQPASSRMSFAPLWLLHLLLWSCHQNSVVTECILKVSWLLKNKFSQLLARGFNMTNKLSSVIKPQWSSIFYLKLVGFNGHSLYNSPFCEQDTSLFTQQDTSLTFVCLSIWAHKSCLIFLTDTRNLTHTRSLVFLTCARSLVMVSTFQYIKVGI